MRIEYTGLSERRASRIPLDGVRDADYAQLQ